jgi:hypothetical protein
MLSLSCLSLTLVCRAVGRAAFGQTCLSSIWSALRSWRHGAYR